MTISDIRQQTKLLADLTDIFFFLTLDQVYILFNMILNTFCSLHMSIETVSAADDDLQEDETNLLLRSSSSLFDDDEAFVCHLGCSPAAAALQQKEVK